MPYLMNQHKAIPMKSRHSFFYRNSLTIVFLSLFIFTLIAQVLTGHAQHKTVTNYLGQAQFWFETFQNWQSEFLSVAAIVFLTIYLRQKGSPESKPVDAPHSETGK